MVGVESKTPQWSKRCRAILGALQAALEDCNKALMSEPNSAAAYDSHDLIHLKMGRLGAAIDDYNPALRLYPKLAWRHTAVAVRAYSVEFSLFGSTETALPR